MALVGINGPAAERHQTLIRNDVRYFINKDYDLGLAYAACRVAWKSFNDKTFNVVAHRGRWHKEANAIDAARANIIYQDAFTGQELIRSPYHVMPRRLWDLKSNRVIEFRMLFSDVLARQCPNSQADDQADLLPSFWAITHSWTSTMAPFETPINQYQWPVPLPQELHDDGGARLRQELLMFRAEYVWLDVLCLKQHSNLPEDNCSLHMRSEEWKLDVPTIGNIYRRVTTIVRYFNGLGLPFKNDGWEEPRHWLRRAWTLQEIRSENETVNAGRPNNGTITGSLMNATGLVAEQPIKLRTAIRPIVELAAEVDSPAGCSVYDLAREMDKRFATKANDKVAGLLYLLRTTQLPTYNEKLSDEEAWTHSFHLLPFNRKIEILGDFPYRGSVNRWFPTWKQLLQWPLRDPQYLHARSVWQGDNSQQSHEFGNLEGQCSVFVPNIWIIPDVPLLQTRGLNEYYI